MVSLTSLVLLYHRNELSENCNRQLFNKFPKNSFKTHAKVFIQTPNLVKFRIGAATTIASVGLPQWLIKTLRRWSSDCYGRYVQCPPSFLFGVSRQSLGDTFNWVEIPGDSITPLSTSGFSFTCICVNGVLLYRGISTPIDSQNGMLTPCFVSISVRWLWPAPLERSKDLVQGMIWSPREVSIPRYLDYWLF